MTEPRGTVGNVLFGSVVETPTDVTPGGLGGPPCVRLLEGSGEVETRRYLGWVELWTPGGHEMDEDGSPKRPLVETALSPKRPRHPPRRQRPLTKEGEEDVKRK